MSLINTIREDIKRDREYLKQNPPQPFVIDAKAIKLFIFIIAWSTISLIAIKLSNS